MTSPSEQNKPGDPETGAIDRAVRVAQLMDLYGPLLTDRQRDFVRLHYNEDLSFGEIAREFDISRQAVHDAVKHAERALENYNSKLGLAPEQAGQLPRREAEPSEDSAAPKAVAFSESAPSIASVAPILENLAGVIDRLEKSGGVLYNVDGVKRELQEIHEHLKGLSGA